MAGSQLNGAAGHFGRQMKKERLSRGWSLMELAQRMGVDAAHLGRVESGKRPPTENLAAKCDEVFAERRGWFSEFYSESRHWPEVPASFKSWPEYEDKAASLRVWSPSIIHGLLQTEAYACALISVQPAITQETVSARLVSRMERQKRVIDRDNPPSAWFVIDELSLYREVGSAQTMAAQLHRLLQVAAMPAITIQVLPAVAHPVNASGFLMADDAVWIEHAAGGFVYTERETFSGIALRFDSLRGECYRVSDSLALIERLESIWKAGASPLTRTATAETA